MDKITYSIIEKNKKVVKIPKIYGRIRAGKRERLVPLGRNMEEAQKWLKRAQRAYEEACDLEAEGKPIPPELLSPSSPSIRGPGRSPGSRFFGKGLAPGTPKKAGTCMDGWYGEEGCQPLLLRNKHTYILRALRAIKKAARKPHKYWDF